MIIHKRECPCADCAYYIYDVPHGHYCNRVESSIVQHRGNGFHYAGQWIIPCGGNFSLYRRRTENV